MRHEGTRACEAPAQPGASLPRTRLAGDRAELFVNGTSLGSKSATVAYNAAPGDLILGGRGDGGNDFKGRLDDVAVYSAALSSSAVARLFSPDPDT